MSKSGAKGKLFRGPLALAGNRGFQPQRKPPVHTGGFICSKKHKKLSGNGCRFNAFKKAVGKWFVDFKGVKKCVGKLKNIVVEI